MSFTTAELSDVSGVSIATLQAMARDGLLPAVLDESSGSWIFPTGCEVIIESMEESSEQGLANLEDELDEEEAEEEELASLEEEEDEEDEEEDDF